MCSWWSTECFSQPLRSCRCTQSVMCTLLTLMVRRPLFGPAHHQTLADSTTISWEIKHSSSTSLSPYQVPPGQCHHHHCHQVNVINPTVSSSVSPSPLSPVQCHHPHSHQVSVTILTVTSSVSLSPGQCQHTHCHQDSASIPCQQVNVIILTVIMSMSSSQPSPGQCHQVIVTIPVCHHPRCCHHPSVSKSHYWLQMSVIGHVLAVTTAVSALSDNF